MTFNDPNLSVAGRVDAFDRAMGGPSERVFFNGWFYYSNGAKRDGEPLGLLAPPPTNDFDRLTNIVSYRKGRLAIAINEFDDLKEICYDAESLERLKGLQAVVQRCNAELEQAKAALAETEQAQAQAGARQFYAEQQQERAAFRAEVKKVRI